MKPTHRAFVLALAISSVLAAPAFALPGDLGRAEQASAAPATQGAFAPVKRAADDLAAEARREQLALTRTFPVRGPFNWGQEAAAFGGPRSGRSHEGQDIMSTEGTPEVAIATGTVLETGNDGGRGNYLNLWDPARKVTYVYMHMQSAPLAKPGQRVTTGQPLGKLGCTGSCQGPHLHLEIREGKGIQGTARDPRPLLEELSNRGGIPATLPPGQG